MQREFSAGGIVFNSKNQVLLVRNYRPDKKIDYWGFPKGHIEKGETGKEAALREVEEETGIKAEIIAKIGDEKYFFNWENEKVFKNVAMFLMKYKSGEVRHQVEELAEARWFEPEEAFKEISFENGKKILEQALEMYGK